MLAAAHQMGARLARVCRFREVVIYTRARVASEGVLSVSSNESMQTEMDLLESELNDSRSKDDSPETNSLLSHRVFRVAFTGLGLDNIIVHLRPNELVSERIFHDGINKLEEYIAKMWSSPSEGLIRYAMIENGSSLYEIVTASKSISRHSHFTPALQAALRREEHHIRQRLRYVRLFALRMQWAELASRLNSGKEDRASYQPSGTFQRTEASHGLAAARRGRRSPMRRAVLLGLFLLIFLTALVQVFGESGG